MRKHVLFSFREVPLYMNVVNKNDIFLSLFNFYKNLVKGDHRNYYNTIYAQMMKYLHSQILVRFYKFIYNFTWHHQLCQYGVHESFIEFLPPYKYRVTHTSWDFRDDWTFRIVIFKSFRSAFNSHLLWLNELCNIRKMKKIKIFVFRKILSSDHYKSWIHNNQC